ncbi:MAG: ROK family protein [Calditerrivibrio sp.]|nr:ROK family protein [Calditerrivibrio sp.]MCA1933451.1 ROK family protein [Calditerrivibrio sp.]MCA1980671.1 ROK family protein [Calditerrivibrio sp.]
MKIVSIDIGGTNTKYGVFDFSDEMRILTSGYFKTPKKIEIMFDLLSQSLTGYNFSMVAVGVPGVYNKVLDKIVYAPNLHLLEHINIKQNFEDYFNCEVIIENDGNMATFGEYFFIEKEKIKNFVMITLGTGVGGGVIYNGDILGGNTTITELGHITINFNGRKCGCGKTGCFEAYCGMKGINETYMEVSGVTNSKVDEIFKRCQSKDSLAKISIELFSYHLASGLSSIANIFSPEKIKIGGGVSFYQNCFFKKTVKYFSKMIFPAFKNSVTLEISELKNNAGLYGGAAFCIKKLSNH